MPRSAPVDGFRLAFDRIGSGHPVVLLHGWPGDRTDYRAMVPRLADTCDLVVPDLRGFGGSDKHPADPAGQYDAAAQARSVVALVAELGLDRPVLAGYDVGSRVAQSVAGRHPDLVRALVVAPPLPGIGRRILDPDAQQEFWYQAFHRLDLAEAVIDGNPAALRAYLLHFWSHWSGPSFTPDEETLAHLVSVYGTPGAFTASLNWYRAGAGSVATSVREAAPAPGDRIAVPTTVLWPEFDPLFPRAWSDRVDDFFADATLQLVDGAGHFAPREYPEAFAAAVRAATAGPA
ncbi:Pimeloyl-ACP methyl ester carboxylesterase [Actinacidiphila yanglinensis]|uniref:Pimeloyl-ACP methyl ester carboxylesterase n=1 Tax=Actinacidiphila yanglinensis TaxID=310779 RepID=A0A1H6AZP7_9ACTN|nr:alpha/beta hydrolase [Actinacidiphila yanglinensis]SEG54048.1 Pimeloyl-ACP methyl ester carboxylesterase [Actinacidiphila yanglinensis]